MNKLPVSTTPTTLPIVDKLSEREFIQIQGTLVAAQRGEVWAELSIGEMDDKIFDCYLRMRREKRLNGVEPTPVGQSNSLPTMPKGDSNYNADTDDRKLRGINRISRALNATV